MVEEAEDFILDECYFVEMSPGLAIVDSGATRTIVGEKVWKTWLDKYGGAGVKPVKVNQTERNFKFGGGEILKSSYEIEFTAVVRGQHLPIVASVVPGSTPFLVSRKTLEQWKVKQDYENGMLKVMDSEWFKPDRGVRGYYLLDLMVYGGGRVTESIYLMEEELVNLEMDGVCLLEESFNDAWRIEALLELEPVGVGEQIFLECDNEVVHEVVQSALKKQVAGRKLRFFEVYVDRGNLSSEMARKYDDVEVSVFGLPDWDFSSKKVQKEFIRLVREVQPHFIWFAPPCTIWSVMQNLNAWTADLWKRLHERRDEEEGIHLQFTRDVADMSEEEDIGFGFEHPHGTQSWKTKPLETMKGYYDAVCNRCQTGLMLEDCKTGEVKKVKKPTRIRTRSPVVYEAMNLPCECPPGSYFEMEGKSAALKEMQNYEIGFVEKAVNACYEEMLEVWKRREVAKILMAEEMEEKHQKRKADESQPRRRRTCEHMESKHYKWLPRYTGSLDIQVVTKWWEPWKTLTFQRRWFVVPETSFVRFALQVQTRRSTSLLLYHKCIISMSCWSWMFFTWNGMMRRRRRKFWQLSTSSPSTKWMPLWRERQRKKRSRCWINGFQFLAHLKRSEQMHQVFTWVRSTSASWTSTMSSWFWFQKKHIIEWGQSSDFMLYADYNLWRWRRRSQRLIWVLLFNLLVLNGISFVQFMVHRPLRSFLGTILVSLDWWMSQQTFDQTTKKHSRKIMRWGFWQPELSSKPTQMQTFDVLFWQDPDLKMTSFPLVTMFFTGAKEIKSWLSVIGVAQLWCVPLSIGPQMLATIILQCIGWHMALLWFELPINMFELKCQENAQPVCKISLTQPLRFQFSNKLSMLCSLFAVLCDFLILPPAPLFLTQKMLQMMLRCHLLLKFLQEKCRVLHRLRRQWKKKQKQRSLRQKRSRVKRRLKLKTRRQKVQKLRLR